MSQTFNELLEISVNEYLNLENISYWQFHFNNIEAFGLFLAWIKIFKYLNVDGTVGKLINTISTVSLSRIANVKN